MERTIRVTGKGNISMKPDQIVLHMILSECYLTYEECLRKSSEQSGKLQDVFEALGFERTDVKTVSFDINTKYEGYRDKNNEWKNRFIGYNFCHEMKVSFAADNALLGKVLYALAHAEVEPEFTIEYTVKDVNANKNRLLHNAVADARNKAEILALASDVQLKEIVTIDYSWKEISFSSRPLGKMLTENAAPNMVGGAYPLDVEPEDISVSDTVTVIWKIE